MSTWVERRRSLLRRRLTDDGGFTLLEIMVALIILGLIAAALAPVMISAARASVVAHRATIAKQLSQQRIDAMRNLTFHIDAQNGPFLDLLDDYYPNLTTSPSLPGGGSGKWVSSGTMPDTGTSGPYYWSTFQNAFGVSGFQQDVYTQFLNSAQPKPAPVPASTLTGMSYDSNTVGHDQPPSMLLGVTVVTSWKGVGGSSKSYTTSTEITASGNGTALITSQSRATALLVKSNDYNGNALEGAVGVVKADGSQANTSSAAAYAQGVYITDAGTGISSPSLTTLSPPYNNGSTGPQTVQGGTFIGATTYSNCGWGSFGKNDISDVSADVTGGLPVAPRDVGTGATPAATIQGGLQSSGGGLCNGFYFTNQVDNSPATDPTLQLDPGYPMVNVTDSTGSGWLASSTGSIAANNSLGTPGAVSATAGVSYVTRVQLFRDAPIPESALGLVSCGPNGASPCGSGLVNVFLTNAALSCGSAESPSGSYSGYLTYYTLTGWKTVDLDWTSASGPATDPLAGVDLSQAVATYNGAPVPLSSYIGSWSTARSIQTSSDGGASLTSAVAITTAPTRANDAGSSIGVEVGNLSCVASDNR